VVWKLGQDGKPVAVPVTIGISDGRQTEITGGELAPGDRIITGIVGQTPAAGPQQQQRGNDARGRMGRFL